jgi:hypothetical protein
MILVSHTTKIVNGTLKCRNVNNMTHAFLHDNDLIK